MPMVIDFATVVKARGLRGPLFWVDSLLHGWGASALSFGTLHISVIG
jgi:hypothetical protein